MVPGYKLREVHCAAARFLGCTAIKYNDQREPLV